MKSYVYQNKKDAFSPTNIKSKSGKSSDLSKSQLSNKYTKLTPLFKSDGRPLSQMKNATNTINEVSRMPNNLHFLQSNQDGLGNTKFLNKEIDVDVKDPSKFFKILDKQHTNVIKAQESRKSGARDWDLFKVKRQDGSKSQMSRTLNFRNLDSLSSKKPESLSVMGLQKDVKENAYSQISANIKYRAEPQETKSVPRQRPVPVKDDAERQLNLINLEKIEKDRPREIKSQLDAISSITRTIDRKQSVTKSRVTEDEEVLSKRWQNLESYVKTKKNKKIRKIVQKIADTLKSRDKDPMKIEEEGENGDQTQEAELNDE